MKLLKNNKGQGMVEYGLILAMLSVGVIAILFNLSNEITSAFNFISDTLLGACT